MGRVDRYRRIRLTRQRYIFSAVIFLALLTAGICAADYSVNTLMGSGSGVNLISVKSNDTSVEITVMNRKIVLDTEYINRDLGRLKQKTAALFKR